MLSDSIRLSLMEDLPPDYEDEGGGSGASPFHSGELSTLPDLTDDAVLDVIKARYQRDLIYVSMPLGVDRLTNKQKRKKEKEKKGIFVNICSF